MCRTTSPTRPAALYVAGAEQVVAAVNDEIAAARAPGPRSPTPPTGTRRGPPTSSTTAGSGRCTACGGPGAPSSTPTSTSPVRWSARAPAARTATPGSPSAIPSTGEERPTPLAAVLHAAGVHRVVVVGLATDYCVKATALDAVGLGFDTTVLRRRWRPSTSPPATGRTPSPNWPRRRHGRLVRPRASTARPHRRRLGRRVSAPRFGMFADLYELTMAASFHAEGLPDTVTFDLFVRSLPSRRQLPGGLRHRHRPRAARGLPVSTRPTWPTCSPSGCSRRRSSTASASCGSRGDVRAGPRGRARLRRRTAHDGDGAHHRGPAGRDPAHQHRRLRDDGGVQGGPGHAGLQRAVASSTSRPAATTGSTPPSARPVPPSWEGRRAPRWCGPGQRYGLPLSGTMAHSYVMAHEDEVDAFRSYLRTYGTASVLLIDTYDTAEGARRAVAAHGPAGRGRPRRPPRLRGPGRAGQGGPRHPRRRRATPESQILASGDLDEDRVAELTAAGAPIDAFGVGTRLGTSADAPVPRASSTSSSSRTGSRRVKLAHGQEDPARAASSCGATPTTTCWRWTGEDVPPDGRPLLAPVWTGRRLVCLPERPLAEARERCLNALAERPRDGSRERPGVARPRPPGHGGRGAGNGGRLSGGTPVDTGPRA